jgi:hypothetical protein
MAVGKFERRARERLRVRAIEESDQRTFAAADQCERVLEVSIGHQRRHGAEYFHLVHDVRAILLTRAQERGADAGSDCRVGVDELLLAAVIEHVRRPQGSSAVQPFPLSPLSAVKN